jgi:Ca-activated chloride channel family protein
MKINQAIQSLEAGGSTAGGAGIQLAYATAKQHFNKEGNNRVICIMATLMLVH